MERRHLTEASVRRKETKETTSLVSFLDRHLGVLLVAPAAAMLLVFAYVPVAGSFRLSFHRLVLSLPKLGEPFVGLDNYRELFASPTFWQALGTTIVFVAASTSLEVVLGLGVALCMHATYRGRPLVRAAALLPWAVPTVVAAQMWRFLFNDRYGPFAYYVFAGEAVLADPGWALASVVIADVWKATPFAALILLAGLQVIPDELYEAAEVDGAGPMQRFFRVTLPLLRPAILVALLFRTIDAFRVFDLVFVMTQGGPADSTNVLQYLGYRSMFAQGMMGSGAAVSAIVFLVTFSVSLVYIRLVGSMVWKGETR